MDYILKRFVPALPISMLVGGAGLFFYGLTIPAYTDASAARALLGPDACDANGVVDGWHDAVIALETMRYPIIQSGISIFLAGLTILGLIHLFAEPGSRKLRTPKTRLSFFLLGTGVLGLSWFSQMQSLVLDQSRGIIPWCADSVGIPMLFITEFYAAFFAICVLVGAALSSQFRGLPVALGQWRSDEPIRSWLITMPFALIALPVILLGLDGARYSSFLGTPAAIVALYLIEAARSALLAKRPMRS